MSSIIINPNNFFSINKYYIYKINGGFVINVSPDEYLKNVTSENYSNTFVKDINIILT